ncbi:MAG: hypothetical protein Q4C64_04960 [Erysipelotrichia bacterium]|nr:hypothetical protein [Erysipelotrichia bacterium]
MKEIKKILPLISILASTVAYFIDKRVCYGIILGSLCNWLYLFVLSKGMNAMFDCRRNLYSSVVGIILRYALMFAPLLYSVLQPQKVHFIGVLIGFLLFKIVLLISVV